MIQNSPTIRRVLYVVTIAVAVLAIGLKPVSPQWADAAQEVATYLGGIAGVTAVSNLSGPTTRRDSE